MSKDSHDIANPMSGLFPELAPRVVPVLVPMPAERPYSYMVPPGMNVQPGSIVRVPLGPREVAGIVCEGETDAVDSRKLREISEVFNCPLVGPEMLRFMRWAADYTLSPPGMVARMVLRVPAAFDPEPAVPGLRYRAGEPERMPPPGMVARMVLRVPAAFDPEPAVPGLRYRAGEPERMPYFEAVAKALDAGRQVLILLPEIALTQQFLDRFHDRFGAKPAEWHSDLAPRTRERVWRQVAEGTVRVVAGARSALFLPFKELGLIVVDEEHDPAYKQEDRVFYNARDMAVVRGHIGSFPVVLASATPSIESQVNAEQGRYKRIKLYGRYAEAALPDLKTIDMRRSPPPPGRFLSPALTEAVGKTVERGEQALLFLNRRGYAPLTLCRVCGHRFQCPQCSSWLVEHRFRGQLMCHQCGYHEPVPQACPECGTLDHLVACGPGVERIAEEVAATFNDARIIVLSSDMAGGVKRLRLELDAIAKGEADIVIGTQLVAKGHNFPNMTLVGVVDADLGLANGDPRAAERTFQLLNQVTGRAGRTGRKSLGLIQTYQPDHPVMRAIVSGDADAFYAREIEERERSNLPPFGRLAALIISADNRPDAENHARALRRCAPSSREISVLGPAEAPLALVRGRHRFRILVHGTKRADIQGFIRALLAAAPKEKGSIRVQVDIDPQSFL
ncbi:primosome assembly protein PriA [Brucella ceti TE10759-12]|uniref:replication restart helicase PriA n=1 Tax=Brucella ceti TaxID=120577 RepID=UPI0003C76B38|nr:primosomal protein N' [Brucella ceti]AHA98881.1 primosome assembly protein PriA [Brucella ceti TE10759-12]